MTTNEAIELVLGWADGSVPNGDSDEIESAAEAARAEIERLRRNLATPAKCQCCGTLVFTEAGREALAASVQ